MTNKSSLNSNNKVKPTDFLQYAKGTPWRSSFEILSTLAVLAFMVIVMQFLLSTHMALAVLWLIPTGLTFTRVFVVMHDLSHRAMYRNRRVNDVLGSILGVLVMTPYFIWQKSHYVHHQEGGNTDRRPWLGDINVKTVREYNALSPAARFRYRLYRNPLVMFILGSVYVFMFDQRFSKSRYAEHKTFTKRERYSIWLTNIAIVFLYGAIIYTLGLTFYLYAVFIPQWIGGAVGVYLFYSQHNFRKKYFVNNEQWNIVDSALEGSSFHDVGYPLRWFTADIGYHHVHTLIPQIPFYRLAECHHANPVLQNAPRLTLRDLPDVISLKLFDEDSHQMITWGEYQQLAKSNLQ